VPLVDSKRGATVDPFMKTVDSEGNSILYLGNSGAFVNASDFDGWSDYLGKEIFPNIRTNKKKKKPLKPKALDWAVGMIWPDQSYASIRTYRGSRRETVGPFHTERIQLLASGCIYCFMSFSGFHVHVI